MGEVEDLARPRNLTGLKKNAKFFKVDIAEREQSRLGVPATDLRFQKVEGLCPVLRNLSFPF